MVLQRKSSSMWELATRKCEIEIRYYTDMGAGDFSLLPFSSVLWEPFKLDQRSLWTFNTHVLILLRKFQRKRAKLRRRKNHLEGLRLALTFSNKRPFGICIKLSEIKLMLIVGGIRFYYCERLQAKNYDKGEGDCGLTKKFVEHA